MKGKADGIITNVRVGATPGEGRSRGSEPQALAVAEGRVLAVGGEADVDTLRGRDTWVLDAAGGHLLPGFVDAHVHLLYGGELLSSLDLRHVNRREDFVGALERFVQDLSPGEWVVGGNWEHERWGGDLPQRGWVDPVSSENPLILARTDMHVAVANSLALERAGINADTPDPPGGEIDRHPESGDPTGILRERAIEMVREVVPPPSPERRRRAIRAAQEHAFRNGVTQAHDMGVMGRDQETWETLAALRGAADEGWLRLRVRCFMPVATRRQVHELVRDEGPGDGRLRWDGVKAFVDGSLGAATAWFHEPYTDHPERTGGPISDLAELRHALLEADRWELQCAVHAIGDRAVDWTLDVRDEMVERHGSRDRRFRVEHAQHLAPAAAARFGGGEETFASVQPYHLVEDGRWAERRLGPERARRAFAFRSLLESGASLALGSDWTVAPLSPLQSLAAATGRRTLDDEHPEGWIPEERLAWNDALQTQTVLAARAGFMETAPGGLSPGAPADAVVVSGSLPDANIDPESPARVDLTMVEGEVVYAREDALRERHRAPAPAGF